MIRWIRDHYPHMPLATGFDDAILGVLHRPRQHAVPVYDMLRMLEIIERQDVSVDESVAALCEALELIHQEAAGRSLPLFVVSKEWSE